MKSAKTKKALSPAQREELLGTLKGRFEKNMNRHQGLEWAKVKAKLEANPGKLWSHSEMERTGGEPDVVGQDKKIHIDSVSRTCAYGTVVDDSPAAAASEESSGGDKSVDVDVPKRQDWSINQEEH